MGRMSKHQNRDFLFLREHCNISSTKDSPVLTIMHYTVTNLEAVGADMFRLVVASVTDVGHFVLTLKATSHPVVNSL